MRIFIYFLRHKKQETYTVYVGLGGKEFVYSQMLKIYPLEDFEVLSIFEPSFIEYFIKVFPFFNSKGK